MSHRSQLYALLTGALLTLLVLGLDAANPGAAIPGGLRSLGATATSPLLTTVARAFPEPPESATTLTETSARLALTEDELRRVTSTVELTTSPTLAATTDSGHEIVVARVVAVGTPGPTGPERLTIDVGSRDGIATDQTVVATAGLLGRTIRVGTTTSDVLIIGAPDLVVGARTDSAPTASAPTESAPTDSAPTESAPTDSAPTESSPQSSPQSAGLLGTVGPPTTAGEPREPGQLTFTAIAFGEATPGDRLLTVGSPDNAPFVAGIPIGEVASVDPSTGRVGLTAAVTPAVDIATLDVVAVIVPDPAAEQAN